MPARVSSSRIGITIISGYMLAPSCLSTAAWRLFLLYGAGKPIASGMLRQAIPGLQRQIGYAALQMRSRITPMRAAALAAIAFTSTSFAQTTNPTTATPLEKRMAVTIDAGAAADQALLAQLVNINSGTMHLAGVVAVKDVLVPRFEALGFHVRWVPMEKVTERAGDLVAEHPCSAGTGRCGKRLLLI